MNTTEISSTRKAMFSMEAYCPSQDCNPHESICAKPRIEFICATHCANPTCGVRAFGVGQMLCRQVVVLQWQYQVGNSRRSVGACGSRQGVLKYGFSRDTCLSHEPDHAMRGVQTTDKTRVSPLLPWHNPEDQATSK